MELKEITNKLNYLSDLYEKDFYLKLYADKSSSIHIIGDDNYCIHCEDFEEIKQSLRYIEKGIYKV